MAGWWRAKQSRQEQDQTQTGVRRGVFDIQRRLERSRGGGLAEAATPIGDTVIVGVLKQGADGMVGAALVLQHHARLLDVLSSDVPNVT